METITQNQHPTEELLEQYAAGKLPSEAVASVSTHLFECDSCYELYENEVNFRISLRNAAAVAAPEPASVPFWSRLFTIPSPALMAAAAAAMLLVLVVPKGTNHTATPVVAELSAMRSAGSTITVESGHPVQLKMKASGIAAGSNVRVQVVSDAGSEVWTGATTVRNEVAELTLDRQLAAGQYWVRLYAQGESEPLREYGLTLK